MGWASGSQLAKNVWAIVRDHIPDEGGQRAAAAAAIVKEFKMYDCDTIDEAVILCKDAER